MAYSSITSNPFAVPGSAAGFLDIRKKGTTSPVVTVAVPAYASGGGTPSKKTLVVVDGNSLEYGDTSSNPPNTGAGRQLAAILDATKFDVVVTAVSGQSLEALVNDLDGQLAGLKNDAVYGQYIYYGGDRINSLAGYQTGLSSNDQVYSLLQQQMQLAQARGFLTIVATLSACMNSYGTTGSSANIETRRNEDTNRVRAYWKDLGCRGLVDIAADSHLGVYRTDFATNADSKDYFYQDGQHFTDFGYAYKATLIKPAVLAVAAGNTYGVVTPYTPPVVTTPYNGPVVINPEISTLVRDGNSRYYSTLTGQRGTYGAYGTAPVKITGVGRVTMALSAPDATNAVLGFYALTTRRGEGYSSFDFSVFNEGSAGASKVASLYGGAANYAAGPATNTGTGSTARIGLDRDADGLVTVIYRADGASTYTKVRSLGTYQGNLIPALDVSVECAAYDLQGEGLLPI